MKKTMFRLCLVAAACLAMLAPGLAAPETNLPVPQLTIALSDGSQVVGVPNVRTIELQTLFAKMEIPWERISEVKLAGGRDKAELEMHNGDRLKGSLNLAQLKLATAFGTIDVNPAHIRQITVASAVSRWRGFNKDGLVFHFAFNRELGQTITDESGKPATVDIHGAKWTPDGKRGGAYQFRSATGDGLQIAFPESPLEVNTAQGELALSAWIKISSDKPAYPVSLATAAGPGSSVGIFFNEGNFYFYAGNHVKPAQSGKITPGKWHHVAGICHSNQTLEIYLDGQAGAPGRYASHVKSAAHSLLLGEDLLNRHCDAVVDDVMLWDHALSAEEIKRLSNPEK